MQARGINGNQPIAPTTIYAKPTTVGPNDGLKLPNTPNPAESEGRFTVNPGCQFPELENEQGKANGVEVTLPDNSVKVVIPKTGNNDASIFGE